MLLLGCLFAFRHRTHNNADIDVDELMNYYGILNLTKEPFSNSPDPDFFFQSREHLECLQKLELSLHLRRGLNVVIGDVGTGKTTLCRQLIRRFTQRPENETHLILDPSFPTPTEFLTAVAKIVSGNSAPEGTPDAQLKEIIKGSLFKKGVDQDKTMILIIDEGQKIPPFCLELLREFLNYETNEFKLLQIVVFAQKEFEDTVRKFPNFADRINLYHIIKPLNFRDTRLMINFRLEKSSHSPHRSPIFSYPALLAIYRATGGYPRKIINLCHQSILAMIIQNRRKVGYFLVRKCAHRVFHSPKRRWLRLATAATSLIVAAIIILSLSAPGLIRPLLPAKWRELIARVVPVPQSTPTAPAPADIIPKVPTETATVAQLVPGDLKISMPTETQENPAAEAAAEPQNAPAPPPPSAAIEIAARSAPTEEVAPAPLKSATYPPVLGTLAIRKNETLSGLIHNIYGVYNSRYFKSLVLANASIEDPDLVPVGQQITIPALPLDPSPPKKKGIWVQLADSDRLQPIYDRLRQHPESAPAVRIISYWTPSEGVRFALVLKQTFSDHQVAELQIKLLPPPLADQGTVVETWGADAVFFSDPYAKK